MNFRLTTMTAEHIPQITAIERACFTDPWSEHLFRDVLQNDAAVMVVAEGEDSTVLGYAELQVVLDEGTVGNVAVAPAYRRQGVADAMLSAFTSFARARLAFLTLEVRASNAPAIALYRKHGFRAVGRRKNYYHAPQEDAILMTLEFDHGTETAE